MVGALPRSSAKIAQAAESRRTPTQYLYIDHP
jgi:hypothetical protein